jgi:hypothetical protein
VVKALWLTESVSVAFSRDEGITMASIHDRKRQQDYPASGTVSRALVLGFLTAGLLGLMAGLIWLGWNWIR